VGKYESRDSGLCYRDDLDVKLAQVQRMKKELEKLQKQKAIVHQEKGELRDKEVAIFIEYW